MLLGRPPPGVRKRSPLLSGVVAIAYVPRVQWPSDRVFFLLATAGYGAAAALGVLQGRRGFRAGLLPACFALAAGWLAHSAALLGRGFSLDRCPVTNLFEALMFVGWLVAVAGVVAALWPRLRVISVLLAPGLFATGVFALNPQLDQPGPVLDLEHAALSLHVVLVLLGYAGFAAASVLGFLYLIRDATGLTPGWQGWLERLPASPRLERVLERVLGGALILLTGGLVISFGLMRERYGVLVRADPKIAWSIVVWAAYLGLAVARLGFKTGPRPMAWGALACFGFVLLTFWGTNLMSPIHHP